MNDLRDRYRMLPSGARGNAFEYVVEKAIAAYCVPGTAAVDAGANYGAHLYNLLRAIGPSGHVWAFEADPEIAEGLRAWLPSNPNLTIVHAALTDYVGEISFGATDAGHKGYGSIFPPKDGAVVENVLTVPATTLDALLGQETLPLSFVKVDIEGAELLLLKGARETLRRWRPVIAMEIDWGMHFDGRPDREAAFFAEFRSLGYALYSCFGSPITASSPGDYVALFVPADKIPADDISRLCGEWMAEFIEQKPDWNPYQKFG
jgi:FkbM family methyltransferase